MASKNIKLNPDETLGSRRQDRRDNGRSFGARPGSAALGSDQPHRRKRSTRWLRPPQRKPRRPPKLSPRAAPSTTPQSVQAVAAMRAQEEENAAKITEIQSHVPEAGITEV